MRLATVLADVRAFIEIVAQPLRVGMRIPARRVATRPLPTVVRLLQRLARFLKLLQHLAPREVAKSKVFTVVIPAGVAKAQNRHIHSETSELMLPG
jgi:hypothetical protein